MSSGTYDFFHINNVPKDTVLTVELLLDQIRRVREAELQKHYESRMIVVSKAFFDLGIRLGAIDKEGNFL